MSRRREKRHAVRKMRVDPSKPPCRGRFQTAISCFGPMAAVVNVMVKRRGIRSRHVGMRKTSANEPLMTHRKFIVGIKTGVATLAREKHGGYLLTGHAVSGVKAA